MLNKIFYISIGYLGNTRYLTCAKSAENAEKILHFLSKNHFFFNLSFEMKKNVKKLSFISKNCFFFGLVHFEC